MADNDTTVDAVDDPDTIEPDDDQPDTEPGDDTDPADEEGDEGEGEGGELGALRGERDRLRKALAEIKAERAELRRTLKAQRTQQAQPRRPASQAPAEPADEPAPPADDSREREIEAELDRLRFEIVRERSVGSILAAGFAGDRAAAADIAKLLDLSDVDPGDVTDDEIGDAVDALKDRFPQLFEPPAPAEPRPARRPTTADKAARDRRAPAMDATTRMSQALLRQHRNR